MEICNYVMGTSTLGDLKQYDGNAKLAELYPAQLAGGIIKLHDRRYDFKCNIFKLFTKTTCLIDETQHLTDTEFKLDITRLKAFIYSIGYQRSSRRALMSSINQLVRKHTSRYELCLSILKLDDEERHAVIKLDRQRVVEANNNAITFNQTFLEEYVNQHKSWNENDTTDSNMTLGRLLICLLAASGARCEEIVSHKYMFDTDEQFDTVLHQSNVAKNRGDARPLHKPLVAGMTSAEFLAIRQTLFNSKKTTKQLQSIVSSVLVCDFPKDFLKPSEIIPMTAHKLRRTYACMSQTYASKGLYGSAWQTKSNSATIIGWSKDVLGHSDLSGSLSYINFRAETKQPEQKMEQEQSLVPVIDEEEDNEEQDEEEDNIQTPDVVIEHSLKRKRDDEEEGDYEHTFFKRELIKNGINPSDKLTDMKKYAALLNFKINNQ